MSFSPPITWVRVSVPMKSVWPRMIRLMPFGNSPFQDLGDQGRARADSGQKRIRKIGGLVLARSSVVTISQDFAIAMPDLRTRVVRTSAKVYWTAHLHAESTKRA